MNPGRIEPWLTSLRLAGWLPVLLWLAWEWGGDYVRLFAPMYRVLLDMVLVDFRVMDFDISMAHEQVFRARVVATRYFFINGTVLPSGFAIDASTPAYVALVHPVVLAAAALSWPGLTWHGRLLRMGLSIPFLVVLEALDVPLVLASSIHDLLTFNLDPLADRASLFVDWVQVMDGGGRVALSIAAAVAAASVHGALQRRMAHG
jgi:hypothetical protein